ncbi:syndecan-2-like [Myripristis murdjan]|uniref:Syndecan n=1 Tax=Myripristis murdjan TaxID=586833 RepID=A0A667YBM2_9TELE|nr:syndecan-2-like [Myripristis murdjan]
MRNLWLLFVVGVATGFISEKLLVSSQSSPADDLYLEGRPSGDFPVDDEDNEDFGSGSGSGYYSLNDVLDKDESFRRFLFNASEATPIQEMSPNEPTTTADAPPNPPTTAGSSQDLPTTVEDTATSSDTLTEEKDTELENTRLSPTADWFASSASPDSATLPPSKTPTIKSNTDVGLNKDTMDNSLPEDNSDDLIAKTSGDELLNKVVQDNEIGKDGQGSRLYEMDDPEEVTSENLWERTEVLAAVIACGVVGFLCAVFLLLLLAYRMKKKDEGSYDLGDTKVPPTAYQKAPTKEFYA